MTSTFVPVSDAELLARVVAPAEPTMPVAAARAILDLHFDVLDIARMNELAEKNRENLLSEAEKSQLESYQRVGHFLNLIQAKAHLSIRAHKGD